MVRSGSHTKEDIMNLLSVVCDPEIPVVTIQEIGMLREVHVSDTGCEVIITPTYTGCPAMGVIEHDIVEILKANDVQNPSVRIVYSPAWTTDWISAEARDKLKGYGIAPPIHSSCVNWLVPDMVNVECPRCHSMHTDLISRFGSTPCKALYKCRDCMEPFDYFKCH